MDASEQSPRAAVKIVRESSGRLAHHRARLRGRTFYAVGGTWRALAKLHMRQRHYPLTVMHGYVIPARDAADFAGIVERVNTETLISIEAVECAAAPAACLTAHWCSTKSSGGRMPKEIMISTAGVREGLIYEMLDLAQRRKDPLIVAASEANQLFSRAPRHAEDLCDWTDRFMKSTHLEETIEEKRLRHAACLLADVNWRAHPDYRGEESLNLVENTALTAIDHPGRAFLALAMSYRYLGLDDDEVSPQIRALATARMLDRARIVAAAIRLAYLIAAAMPDVLPHTPVACFKSKVVLTLPAESRRSRQRQAL